MSAAPGIQKRDWRLPENRREAFRRFFGLHLKYKAHPGLVYSWLPAFQVEEPEWLVWLNGNTQNPVTTSLLFEAAPTKADWRKAVEFWNDNFKTLQWDIDRRYQKSKFGEATERWANSELYDGDWTEYRDWDSAWKYSMSHPYMGRLSAWSMLEYARILIPGVPDATNMLLHHEGSSSHRNGLAVVSGQDAAYWSRENYTTGDLLELELLSLELLEEQDHPDASRLTLESALCTYKSWHKPRRRYAGVYADMAYERLKWAEERHGERFPHLWAARQADLPWYWRLEDTVGDVGLVEAKQNHYLETGEPVMMSWDYPDMENEYDDEVRLR